MQTAFSTKFSAALRRSGLTQKALAARAGITPSYVSQICAGKKRPTLTTLTHLCEILNVHVSDLLSDGDTPSCTQNHGCLECLTDKERKLLIIYRSLSPSDRSMLEQLAATLPRPGKHSSHHS
ncbi:MAG: helix-turn-helix domain-containing protein [Clostridia bacterium]|nr:helix-turn-helix domain-containing protein [Clostridia bacterium]